MLPGSEPRPWPCPLEATSEFRYYSAVRCFGRSMAHPPRRGHYPPRPSWWHQVRQNSMVGGRRTEHFNVSVVPPWTTTLRNPAPVTSILLPPLILSWARQVRALNGQNYMVGDRQTEHADVFAAPPWMTALNDSAPVLSTLLLPSILSWAEAGSRAHQTKSHGRGPTNRIFRRLRRIAMDNSTPRPYSRPLNVSSTLNPILGEAGSRAQRTKSHGRGPMNQIF